MEILSVHVRELDVHFTSGLPSFLFFLTEIEQRKPIPVTTLCHIIIHTVNLKKSLGLGSNSPQCQSISMRSPRGPITAGRPGWGRGIQVTGRWRLVHQREAGYMLEITSDLHPHVMPTPPPGPDSDQTSSAIFICTKGDMTYFDGFEVQWTNFVTL